MSETDPAMYTLPSALVTRADLARLVREVEDLDNELEAQKARNHSTGKASYHLPTTSKGLNDFCQLNSIDIADDQGRMALKEHLRVLKDKAPIMHMTFAVTAEPEFLQELVGWLREQIHPQALISVGLQPALVGGVYVRTPNHVHDFSLRELMAGKRNLITDQLDTLMRGVVAESGEAGGPVIQTGVVPVAAAPVEPVEPAEPALQEQAATPTAPAQATPQPAEQPHG